MLEFSGGRLRHLLARTATGSTEIQSVRRGTSPDLSGRTHFSFPRTGLPDRVAGSRQSILAITSGLPVIRSQSVASANGASKFYVPDLRLEAIVAPLLFRHVGVLKAWRFSSLCRWIRAPVEVVNLRESSASKEAG